MAAPKKGPRLGAGPAHQDLLLAQQAGDLFRHGRITTTLSKAKTLRPYAEKLITKGKKGDLPARRAALAKLRDRDVVAYLFEDVAPRFADRNGGYTRILKLDPRKGDNAQMAIIELVEQAVDGASGEEVIEESKGRRRRGIFGRGRRRAAEAVTGTAGAVTGAADDLAERVGGPVESVVDAVTDAVDDAAEAVADVVDGSDDVVDASDEE